MYTAVKPEYEKVNNYVKTKEDQRSEQSRKAAQARWSNTTVMQQHTHSNANTDTDTDTGIGTVKVIGKGTDLGMVWDKIVNE